MIMCLRPRGAPDSETTAGGLEEPRRSWPSCPGLPTVAVQRMCTGFAL